MPVVPVTYDIFPGWKERHLGVTRIRLVRAVAIAKYQRMLAKQFHQMLRLAAFPLATEFE